MPATGDRRRIHCNLCNRVTNHDAIGGYKIEEPPIEDFWEVETHTLWKCAGCETPTLESAYTNSEWVEPDTGFQYRTTYHPERALARRAAKVFADPLPEHLQRIYEESVQALNSGLELLSAGGLRAVIEAICTQEKIGGRNLAKRLDGLVQKGTLPAKIVKGLHELRFMGNQALHEFDAPSREDLLLAMDICEGVLAYLYELDLKAARLQVRASLRTAPATGAPPAAAPAAGAPVPAVAGPVPASPPAPAATRTKTVHPTRAKAVDPATPAKAAAKRRPTPRTKAAPAKIGEKG